MKKNQSDREMFSAEDSNLLQLASSYETLQSIEHNRVQILYELTFQKKINIDDHAIYF